MKFEVVIPVLNEEETLEKNVTKSLVFLENHFKSDVTLCVADSGSTDKTFSIAEQLSQKYSQVRVIKVHSRGVGLALKSAWTSSNADIVGYMDLDLATNLKHLTEVEDAFTTNQCDILYGSRLHKKSIVIGRKPLRGFISVCFNLIVRLILRSKISDNMCGFKFLKKDILQKLMNYGAESDGWFFCAEILLAGERLGYRLKELPVEWTDDPNSKVKIAKLTVEYLKNIIKLRKRFSS